MTSLFAALQEPTIPQQEGGRSTWVRRVFRALATVFGGLAALWGVTVLLILAAGARPQLYRADVILVAGAAQYNGRPSPVLRARLDHAIALYRRELAGRLLVTGGVGTGDTVSEAEVARRYAIARGVPAAAILAERQGRTSAESVRLGAALLRAHGYQRVLLVSDPFHMLRLELLARRHGLRTYRAPTLAGPIDRSPGMRWRFVLRESVLFPATALLGGR